MRGKPDHEGLDILPCVQQLGAAAKDVEFLGEGNDIAAQALHLTERLLLDGGGSTDATSSGAGRSFRGRDAHQTPTATRITAANAPAMAGLNHQAERTLGPDSSAAAAQSLRWAAAQRGNVGQGQGDLPQLVPGRGTVGAAGGVPPRPPAAKRSPGGHRGHGSLATIAHVIRLRSCSSPALSRLLTVPVEIPMAAATCRNVSPPV